MPDSLGDQAQIRVFADQIAKSAATVAVAQFIADNPGYQTKAEVPAPLKWAAVIVSALLTLGIGGTATWLVTTVNEMQVTLARMDERQQSSADTQDGRFDDLERRIGRLEERGEGNRS